MVNREHSLATQHSSLKVFTTFDSMEEIDDNEKSNQNIETRKLTQQPNSHTKKTISNERRYYI